ncbi:MAG: hypothetical protein ACLPVY_14010 [Acidimicrobiia bacterium]
MTVKVVAGVDVLLAASVAVQEMTVEPCAEIENLPDAVGLVPTPTGAESVSGCGPAPFKAAVHAIDAMSLFPVVVSFAVTDPFTGPVLNQPFVPSGVPAFGDDNATETVGAWSSTTTGCVAHEITIDPLPPIAIGCAKEGSVEL